MNRVGSYVTEPDGWVGGGGVVGGWIFLLMRTIVAIPDPGVVGVNHFQRP